MHDALPNSAKSVFKTAINDGVNNIKYDEPCKKQIKPVLSFKYYHPKKENSYICEFSPVITIHKSKINLIIELSFEEDAINNKFEGKKHSINKIDERINLELNKILSDSLSDCNVFSPKINLYAAYVEPNIKFDSVTYRDETKACVTYYAEKDITFYENL